MVMCITCLYAASNGLSYFILWYTKVVCKRDGHIDSHNSSFIATMNISLVFVVDNTFNITIPQFYPIEYINKLYRCILL